MTFKKKLAYLKTNQYITEQIKNIVKMNQCPGKHIWVNDPECSIKKQKEATKKVYTR